MKLSKQGFLQAFGVAVYCTLVGLFMWNANHIFGQMNNVIGPITILLLLSVSVLICGILVFYKPYKLFFSGKKNEAVEIVFQTAIWLFIFFVLFLAGTLLFK